MARKAMWVLGAMAIVVGAIGFIGLVLPREHAASVEIRLEQSADRVFEVISDVPAATAWRSDLEAVEFLPDSGHEKRWRETTDWGTVTMALDESRPPTHLVTRIADDDQPFAGRWSFDLAPSGDGTVLTITEHGEVYNPFFRFMSRFVFGHHRTLETYARDLSRHLGSSAEPTRVQP